MRYLGTNNVLGFSDTDQTDENELLDRMRDTPRAKGRRKGNIPTARIYPETMAGSRSDPESANVPPSVHPSDSSASFCRNRFSKRQASGDFSSTKLVDLLILVLCLTLSSEF